MEVVLKKDYDGLGKAMDVITVKNGYARNFLFPQEIAVLATEGNKKSVAEQKRFAERKEEKRSKEARQLAKKIENVPCTIPVSVGEDDKIFGSVTAQDIAGLLKKEGYDIDKRSILLDEPIKKLGVYNVAIALHKDVKAKLKVWVVKEEQK